MTTVTLDNPGRFERITAVAVNGSYDKSGWNGQDWNWTRDQQPVSVAATAVTGGGAGRRRRTRRPGDAGDGGGPGNPGGGGQTGGGSAGGGTQDAGTTLLSVKAGAAPRLGKAKALTFTVRSGAAGTFSAIATVERGDGQAPRPRPARGHDRHRAGSRSPAGGAGDAEGRASRRRRGRA